MALVDGFGSHRTHLAATSQTSLESEESEGGVSWGWCSPLIPGGRLLLMLVERDLERPELEPVTCLRSGRRKRPFLENSAPRSLRLEPWRSRALAARTVATARTRRTLVQ